TSASVSSGSTCTSRPPCPLAETDMLPPTRNARPPNIRCSVRSGSPAISSRIQLARSSSYATSADERGEPAERDDVAGLQLGAAHPPIVDEEAVGRVEVADGEQAPA